jgi:hypothetical protein
MATRKAIEEQLKHFMDVIFPAIASKAEYVAKIAIEELPKWEGLMLEIFEIMFSPRQMFRQVVIISAVQLLIMAGVAIEEAGNSLVMFLSKAEREQQKVTDTALSYQSLITLLSLSLLCLLPSLSLIIYSIPLLHAIRTEGDRIQDTLVILFYHYHR